MTEAETAWLAGLFEGEGSIILIKLNGRWGGKQRHLRIQMTDHDVIEEAHRVSDAGTVRGPWVRGVGYKPIWMWEVSRWPDIERLLVAMLPWFGARRAAKAREMLSFPARKPGGLRRTHCVRGHEKNETNTYVNGNQRHCRVCIRNRARARRAG